MYLLYCGNFLLSSYYMIYRCLHL